MLKILLSGSWLRPSSGSAGSEPDSRGKGSPAAAQSFGWAEFWKKWLLVGAFLSAAFFERLSAFPSDLRTVLVRCLIPIGPAWALFLLRSTRMRPGMIGVNFVMAALWIVTVIAAAVFWFDPDAKPLTLQVGAGDLLTSDAHWIARNRTAGDGLQVDAPDRLRGDTVRIVIANRSGDAQKDLVVSVVPDETTRLVNAVLRFVPYSDVAPLRQRWLWTQLAQPAERAGTPGGFCHAPSPDDWMWCKEIGVPPRGTVTIRIRRLDSRQAAILYLEASSTSMTPGPINVRAGDLQRVTVAL